MQNETIVENRVHELVLKSIKDTGESSTPQFPDDESWKKVRQLGTQLWLDTGDMDEAGRLWNQQFQALTTNNTLLNKEVQKGIYDDLVKETASALRRTAPDMDENTLVLEIAFVLNAHHGLRLVRKFDAYVSVELHTDLGNDLERTVTYGKRYFAICPERFYVKVPLTPAGFLAARRLSAERIPINFTLGFSARQNYLAALLTRPKFVNVFMGRLNAFVADNKLGSGENVGEKATLATQRQLLDLRKEGRTDSLLIGASMRSGLQVASLGGLDVYTMPTKVASQYRENPVSVTRQVDNDPVIEWAEGVRPEDCNAATLWDVPNDFKQSVEQLLAGDLDRLSGSDLQKYFSQSQLGDFLPQWTDDEIEVVRQDGKIPVFKTWADKLAAGKIGLDALMNISALYSFVADQKALDGRIRSLA